MIVSRLTPAHRSPRWGIAAVECALVMPFFAIFLLGIAEFGRALAVRQVLNDAVRKACRTGALPNKTSANITSDINDILTDNSISTTAATITIKVNGASVDASTAVKNDQISVQVSVPYSQVGWVPALFMSSSASLSATLVMMRQG